MVGGSNTFGYGTSFITFYIEDDPDEETDLEVTCPILSEITSKSGHVKGL